jgi:CheY-like chemotaxis protein
MLGNMSALLLVRSDRARALLADLLSPHCREVAVCASVEQALEQIGGDRPVELFLSDVYLQDGDVFDLLRQIPSEAEPMLKVILMASPWRATEATLAEELGAIAYLPKPIGIEEIVARVWFASEADPSAVRPRLRRRSLSKVQILEASDDGESIASSGLHNVSVSGAFLETRGPLSVGAEILMQTTLGNRTVRARGTIVRVQEPSWIHVGGVGVRFDSMDDASSEALHRFVYRESEPEAAGGA